MKKLTAFIFLCSAASLSVSAQKKFAMSQMPRSMDWVDSPRVSPVPPEYANEDAVYLVHDVNINYKYEGRDTNTFYTEHNIIKVLDERGIEMFNTVRIPLDRGTRASIKARTIDASGAVHVLDKKMIKQTKDETGRTLMSIAFEGVGKNAELEYTVKLIWSNVYAEELFYQSEVPIAKARFDLSYPKQLNFEFKSHSGFPEVEETISHGRKHASADLTDIPAMETEPASFPGLHRMAIEFRASSYSSGINQPVNTLDQQARDMFDTYYRLSDREKKSVNTFLSDLGVRSNGSEADNIKKIEQGIKSKITLYPVVDYDQRTNVKAVRTIKSVSRDDVGYEEKKDLLDTVLSRGIATAHGYIRLFAACFEQAGISNQLGLAGDRSEYKFDERFESTIGLTNYIFYFPNLKKFLDPVNIYLRFPVVDEHVVGGKGFFCIIPQRGDITGGLYTVRTITPLSAKESVEKVNASVSFDTSMDATVDVVYSWSGYLPTQARETLPFYPKDRIKDLITSWVPFAEKPDDIEKYTISNEGFDNAHSSKPLELYASVHANRLVSKTDKEYIFRLGAIIGPQFNLYADDRRKMPVDFFYPFTKSRTITVNIPKGYKVLNPDAIRMNADYLNDNEETVISFASDYTLVKDKEEGDKLVVTVNEFYNQLHFGLNEYDRYRKVVNTAADFNKITLLMGREHEVVHHRHHAKKKAAVSGTQHVAAPSKPAVNSKPAPKMAKTAAGAKTIPVAAPKPAPITPKPAPVTGKPALIKVGPPKK